MQDATCQVYCYGDHVSTVLLQCDEFISYCDVEVMNIVKMVDVHMCMLVTQVNPSSSPSKAYLLCVCHSNDENRLGVDKV